MPLQSHDEHFADQPAAVRLRLEQVQQAVESRVPGVTRTVSYNMPAFQSERTFFYFAAFTKHIGIYPPVAHDQALPVTLIGRIALALAAQYRVR